MLYDYSGIVDQKPEVVGAKVDIPLEGLEESCIGVIVRVVLLYPHQLPPWLPPSASSFFDGSPSRIAKRTCRRRSFRQDSW